MDIANMVNQFALSNAWVGVVIGCLWGVDQILKVVAPLTKSKVDDNLADYLGKFLAAITGKDKP